MSTTQRQPGSTPTELEQRVKTMYEEVALEPEREFHFETGRRSPNGSATRPPTSTASRPRAIDSFAGVGYFLDLAAISAGETVLDLGSGSGTDSFLAALAAGAAGRVIGIDMTDAAARQGPAPGRGARLRAASSSARATSSARRSTTRPVDCVISNGVINLSPDKPAVFAAAARALRPGGRLALADIVTAHQLPEGVTCDASLWAACIGGAMQRDDYRAAIESAGFEIETWRENTEYRFVSERADNATQQVRRHEHLAARPTPLIHGLRAFGNSGAYLGVVRSVASICVVVAVLVGCGAKEEAPPAGSRIRESFTSTDWGAIPPDGSLMIATHTGLFRVGTEGDARYAWPIAIRTRWGFTVVGPDHFLGSGHPGSVRDDPPFLGLIESRDAGNEWRPISLRGKVDFPCTRGAGRNRVRIRERLRHARGALPSKRGRTDAHGFGWHRPRRYAGLAIDPRDPRHIVALGEQRGYVSRDAGSRWRPLGTPGGLVTWTRELGVYRR